MNLESKKTKVIFLVVSSILVIGFVYISYIKKDTTEEKKGRTHSLQRGKDASNLETARRSSNRNYERDVKDYSFNDYISDQKEEAISTNTTKEEEEEKKEEVKTSKSSRSYAYNDYEEDVVPVRKVKTKNQIQKEQSSPIESEPIAIQTIQTTQPQKVRRTGFSGGGSAKPTSSSASTINPIDSESIKAVVLQTKKIKNGDNVLLRTTEQSILQGRAIPENTLVAGIVNLSGARLNITVNAIAIDNESIECKLNAYDLDGNVGLKMNKDISYEVKSETTGNVVSEVANAVNVPYVGRLASSIGNKVISDPTITLSQGQKMYLRPN